MIPGTPYGVLRTETDLVESSPFIVSVFNTEHSKTLRGVMKEGIPQIPMTGYPPECGLVSRSLRL